MNALYRKRATAWCGGLLLIAHSWAVHASDTMVLISGGRYSPLFKRADGSSDIEINAFVLDRFAVSNKDYLAFTDKVPRWKKHNIKPIFSDANYLKHLSAESFPAVANQPVVNIPWFAARAYCKSLGKRLPSTGEWEFAAQASASAANGNEDPQFQRTILDWYAKPASDPLPNIEDTPANFWGVHGMHGVVWELVSDFNTALVTGESRGDTQLESQLFCGAGAAAAIDPSDYAAFMRYALRSSYRASYTMESLGFRCAKNTDSDDATATNSRGHDNENN